MKGIKNATSGISKLPDGRTCAVAYKDTSPEIKKEIMERIPEDVRDFVTKAAKQFGRLHFVGVKWHV